MPAPRVDTPATTPLLERVLGYGPALVVVALGVLAWIVGPLALEAGRLLSAAILLFLAGVTRGLSFFTPGGERAGQLAAMLLRFVCGMAALALPATLAFPVLIAGYASVAVYDPIAARGGTAPRFFAHLRPLQMAIVLAGLLALWARSIG